jgi:hypothetical protein
LSRDELVCTGESCKKVVKMTFARATSLPDPDKLQLQPRRQRVARDRNEGEALNEKVLKALICAVVDLSKATGRRQIACR